MGHPDHSPRLPLRRQQDAWSEGSSREVTRKWVSLTGQRRAHPPGTKTLRTCWALVAHAWNPRDGGDQGLI